MAFSKCSCSKSERKKPVCSCIVSFFLVLDSNIPTHCRLEQQTYYMIYQEWVITTSQDAYRNGKYKARYLFILSSRFAHYRGDKQYIVRTQLCFKFAIMNTSSELVLPLLSTN